ncbi:MAG: tetratricopeptide repeat protein, partial [Pseudomonadales bacterium]
MVALLLVTFAVYSPGLSGPYLLDDIPNLQTIGDIGVVSSRENLSQYVFGNISGPLGRPVSMASFLLDAQDWPANPANFKYTNLMLHLLCGVLLFHLGMLLFGFCLPGQQRNQAPILATLLAGLWLLHPLNLSTTLYIVQRMTQLMTLFSLAALLCFCSGRMLLARTRIRGYILICASLFPFGLLAVLSKENGALLLMLIVALEVTVFRKLATEPLFKWWLRLAVIIPIFLVLGYLAYTLPDSLLRFETRPFSLAERLMTE